MVDKASEERRAYVREDLSFKVQFRIIAPEEYEKIKGTEDQILSTDKDLYIDISDTENRFQEIASNAGLIDFLLQMDEKLDRILTLLSKDDAYSGPSKKGMGTNISGSGMKIIVDTPVQIGQIIHTNFVLSRHPLVFINVFGEVVQVTPADEGNGAIFTLGIEFLELNPNDRERIIACVFQRQREAIRKRRIDG